MGASGGCNDPGESGHEGGRAGCGEVGRGDE